MLPYLKNKDEAVSVLPVETKERKPDDDSYDMLDAVAEDILAAVAKKDKGLLKNALAALYEHWQSADVKQDSEMMGE